MKISLLLRPVPPFTSKHHQNISKWKSRWKVKPFVPVPLFTSKYCQDTIVNEKLAKRSTFLHPFHHLLVNSERILVNANLAKTVMPFLPASPFTSIIIIKIPVNENIATKSCHFGPFYHSAVHVVYILVNENIAKRSYLLFTFHHLLVEFTYIPWNEFREKEFIFCRF